MFLRLKTKVISSSQPRLDGHKGQNLSRSLSFTLFFKVEIETDGDISFLGGHPYREQVIKEGSQLER